jgi:C4-dicarboxylate-specific signal transduction histidine kinase
LYAQAIFLQQVAATALTDSVEPALHAHLQQLGSATHTRLTIIRQDGVVVVDSEVPLQQLATKLGNQTEQPEIAAARSGSPGVATRLHPSLGQPTMYLALPVQQDDNLIGYVSRGPFSNSIVHRRERCGARRARAQRLFC